MARSPETDYGITRDGKACKNCLKQQGYCHLHQSQSRTPQVGEMFGKKTSPAATPSYYQDSYQNEAATFGFTKDGTPCKTCIRSKGFCHMHQAQAPKKAVYYTAEGVDPPTLGVTKSGQACGRCAKLGGFCHWHQPQDGAPKVASWGIKQDGTSCQLCVQRQGYCHMHKAQSPDHVVFYKGEDGEDSEPALGVTKEGKACGLCTKRGRICHMHQSQKKAPKVATWGTKQDGTPCKVCIQRQGYCHMHQAQSPDNVVYYKADETTQPTLGVTKHGKACGLCAKRGNLCHLHQSQESAPRVATWGIKQDGSPCKLCIQRQGYCHKHQAQTPLQQEKTQTWGVTKNGSSCKLCLRAQDFCHLHRATQKVMSEPKQVHIATMFCQPSTTNDMEFPTKDSEVLAQVWGLTKEGRPCKLCIRKQDYCHFHVNDASEGKRLKSLVFGVTKKGEACKLCIRKGGFCHLHEAQKPEDQKVLGITRKGTPCKLCLKKGDYCHFHQVRETKMELGLTKNGKACRLCNSKGSFCHLHLSQQHEGDSAVSGACDDSKQRNTQKHASKNSSLLWKLMAGVLLMTYLSTTGLSQMGEYNKWPTKLYSDYGMESMVKYSRHATMVVVEKAQESELLNLLLQEGGPKKCLGALFSKNESFSKDASSLVR